MFLVNSTGKEPKPVAAPTQPTSAAAGSLIPPTIAHVAPSTAPAVSVAPPVEGAPSKITHAEPSSAPAASVAPPVEAAPSKVTHAVPSSAATSKAQSKAPPVIAFKSAPQEEAPVDDEAASADPPKSPSKAVELDGVLADPENPAEGSDDDKDKPSDEQSHISMFQKIE